MKRRVRAAGRRTFRAISVRNYRLYFTGQVISVSGTWMQTVAQAYLILFPLHGTGVDVAIATSLQFLPLLLLGPFGGLVADRADKRKVLYATQATAGMLALVLGVAVVTHSANLWEVYVLAAGLGFVNLFDNPARQTFVSEMVGLDLLPNAVSLNSVLMNSARVIGPAIGGVLILVFGVAACFFINAASYAAVIVALGHDARLGALPAAGGGPGQGPGPRGAALRVVHARPEDPAALHGPRRRVRLQLHRHPATAGEVHLPRRRWPLQLVPGGHGGGRCCRRPCHGISEPTVDPPAGEHRRHLRTSDPGGGAVADTGLGHRATRPDGGCEHFVRGDQQRHVAAAGGPGHARPRHVAQRHRLPRQHPIGAPLLGYISDVTNPRVALVIGGVGTLVASIPLFVLGARQRREGTEGLVMGLAGRGPTNVVPLPVTEASYEPRERRTS